MEFGVYFTFFDPPLMTFDNITNKGMYSCKSMTHCYQRSKLTNIITSFRHEYRRFIAGSTHVSQKIN